MTTLTTAELQNLKINIDDSEIRNDLRILIPHYDYELNYVGLLVDSVTYNDLVLTTVDSDSISKYGRRTKINKHQVMDKSFQDAWSGMQKQEYAEPFYSLQATLSPEQITKMLTTKISDVLTVTETTSGVNNEYIVTNWVLEARPGITTCTLGLKELDTDQQIDLFWIDTDSIDGDHLLGW
jgi:hypothetical protein